MTTVFDPIYLAGRRLPNRVVMAPMTRSRAYGPGGTVTGLTATYYAQRASAGLIVTEGIQPSAIGQGYPNTPGLHTDEQVKAWKDVTNAVHAAGGTIFAQLMHTGRIGHPSLTADRLAPVAPSPVPAAGQVYTVEGPQDYVTPRELDDDAIRATIADFAAAARNAIAAGFDGVELHSANGYLLHQFLAPNTNQRTDAWGGSPAGRARLAAEVTDAVVAEVGADRVGIRLSPGNPFNDIAETDIDDVTATYTELVTRLARHDLAYLHVIGSPLPTVDTTLRKAWPGTFVLNPMTYPDPTGPDAIDLVAEGSADLIAFGALFLANPDLPRRLALGGPYNAPDPATFYGGDHRGYTDYPAL
ncbi:alkene reductase [Amycolatopsis sp. lyj-90]|uniref:alkene reductase n=1 Tax=Amycolatopsis sp. lyj-90 TaxID=2789285 RepID=UPI003978529E